MQSELARIQLITLSSIVVLIVLCVVLVAVMWLALNLNDVLKLVMDRFRSHDTPEDVRSEEADPEYRTRQTVCVTEDFVIDGGLGQVIRAGEIVELIERKQTSNGPRWSALAASHATFIPYLPEELIRSLPELHIDTTDPLMRSGYPETHPHWTTYPTG